MKHSLKTFLCIFASIILLSGIIFTSIKIHKINELKAYQEECRIREAKQKADAELAEFNNKLERFDFSVNNFNSSYVNFCGRTVKLGEFLGSVNLPIAEEECDYIYPDRDGWAPAEIIICTLPDYQSFSIPADMVTVSYTDTKPEVRLDTRYFDIVLKYVRSERYSKYSSPQDAIEYFFETNTDINRTYFNLCSIYLSDYKTYEKLDRVINPSKYRSGFDDFIDVYGSIFGY